MHVRRAVSQIGFLALITTAALSGQNLFANTVAVGPSTCLPGRAHYSTIQAAVSAVPAGTYPEQVVITQPLTLIGVIDGTGAAAVITVPAAGLVQNANSPTLGTTAAQLLVQGTVNVTIKGLAIDGTGSGCVAGAAHVVGLQVNLVGAPNDGTTAMKIQNVVVRNELDTCISAEGIWVDTSYLKIESSEIHDIDSSSIAIEGGQASVTNNNVQNSRNGIVTSHTDATTLISNNTVSNLNPSFGSVTGSDVGSEWRGNSHTKHCGRRHRLRL